MSYSALSHGGVARVSTLIVDAQLDTGAFGIKADIIEESTPAAGVSISPPRRILLDLSASDNIRAYDDSQITIGDGSAYEKAKTLTIPSRYKQGQTCRVTTAIASYGGYVQVYVNGAPAGAEHTTTSSVFVTFTDDITVGGGDNVEMWVKTDSGKSALCGLFTVGGDDAIPDLFYGGEAWP